MTLSRKELKRVHSPNKSPRLVKGSPLMKKLLKKSLTSNVQFGSASKANVKVVVRVRPQNPREIENNATKVVDVIDEHMLVFDPKKDDDGFFFKGIKQGGRDLNKKMNREQKFVFENVFNEEVANQEVYEATTKDLIDTILDGYNCSVFAYGATGAGKTYTMLGKPEIPGITFLTVMELFKRIEEISDSKSCEVGVSYLEVYNETVKDLLKPGKPLNVLETGKKIEIHGLSLHKPKCADELMQMLADGNCNRSQHPTDINAESSRSHAVFQVFVKMQDKVDGMKSNVSIAKLSMIDLAGSERGCATGFKGVRFREGASINRSLLALGNCINALADGQKHIPYRDSKLTRLLKDSLGGNCRSVMIAAISTASTSYEDTLNTLKYANRAKTIKTTLKKNIMNVNHHVSQYVKIVESLKEEISVLQSKLRDSNVRPDEPCPNCLGRPLTPSDNMESVVKTPQRSEVIVETVKAPIITEEEKRLLNELTRIDDKLKHQVKELLRLESTEKDLFIKNHIYKKHQERANIFQFASSRLDKSVSKCDRLLHSNAARLEGIQRNIEELKPEVTDTKAELEYVQKQLEDFDDSQADEPSRIKLLIENQLLKGNVRDQQQVIAYYENLLKLVTTEQNQSEILLDQLLNHCKQFYLSLRVVRSDDPDKYDSRNDEEFKKLISTLDNYKVGFEHNKVPCDISIQKLTQFSCYNDVIMSPTAPAQSKCVRSILKGSASCSSLPSTKLYSAKNNSLSNYSSLFKLLNEDVKTPSTERATNELTQIKNQSISNDNSKIHGASESLQSTDLVVANHPKPQDSDDLSVPLVTKPSLSPKPTIEGVEKLFSNEPYSQIKSDILSRMTINEPHKYFPKIQSTLVKENSSFKPNISETRRSLSKSASTPNLDATFDLSNPVKSSLSPIAEVPSPNTVSESLDSTYVQESSSKLNKMKAPLVVDSSRSANIVCMPSRSRNPIALSSIENIDALESPENNTQNIMNSLNSTFNIDEKAPDADKTPSLPKDNGKESLFTIPNPPMSKSFLKPSTSRSKFKPNLNRTPCRRTNSLTALHGSGSKPFEGKGILKNIKRTTSFLGANSNPFPSNQENVPPIRKLKTSSSSVNLKSSKFI